MPFSGVRRPESMAAIGCLILLGVLWASFRADADSAASVNHTVSVRRNLLLLSRSVIDTQRQQRGFLLTGRDLYVSGYERGKTESNGLLAELLRLTEDNEAQQERLRLTFRHLADLHEELDWTVEQVRTGMKPDAYRMVDTDRGERNVRAIRDALDDCYEEEDELLRGRTRQHLWTFRMVVTSTIMTSVLFSIGFVSVWSRVRVRPRPIVYLGPERRKSW